MLTARGAEQQSKGTDTVSAGSTWPGPRPARPPVLRVRLPHRPGQRPGRPGARPEGRPAPRLPLDRRPGGPRARRRASGAWTPTTLPAPGALGLRAARLARARPAACAALLVFGSNPVVSAPPRGRVEARLRALDLLVVADFVLLRDGRAGRRRAAGRPVGRGGRHDDQPGGPGDPAPPGALDPPARRPHRPGTLLSAPARRRGSAVTRGGGVRPRPTPTTGGLRRAAAGLGRRLADYAGHQLGAGIGAGGRRLLAVPLAATDPDGAGHRPGSSPTPSPPRGRARFAPVGTGRRPRRSAPTTRCTSPPGGCWPSTSPARRPGGSPRCAGPPRTRSSSCTPTWPPGSASTEGERSR